MTYRIDTMHFLTHCNKIIKIIFNVYCFLYLSMINDNTFATNLYKLNIVQYNIDRVMTRYG